MTPESPVTAVQRHLARRRWRLRLAVLAFVLVFLIGLATLILGGIALVRFTGSGTPEYVDIREHFKYGSIGSEPASGLPYWIWRALPVLFAAEMKGKGYEHFGFLYENDAQGKRRDLPIGISSRTTQGIRLVWLNCAVCHVGTYRREDGGPQSRVLGMPGNNFDLHGFIRFLFTAAVDERFSTDHVMTAIEELNPDFGWMERLVFRHLVIPRVQQGLIQRRSRLGWLVARQPAWGPGRVDTFNPYKAVVFNFPVRELPEQELIGTSDFPSIFLQAPREGMQLHWDGNNTSLHERNLSAAIGAGVTPATVDFASIERIAGWLGSLAPPVSLLRDSVSGPLAKRGKSIYMKECAACHGWMDDKAYRFQGAYLGKVEPIGRIATDPFRFNSYTEKLAAKQGTLFAGQEKHHFRNFRKTKGYANMPLDGLWLRAPYLHNGSVANLADLLQPPERRMRAFTRGSDLLDPRNGGFASRPCRPESAPSALFCYDTTLPGNGNGGHRYGTNLGAEEKEALLAYLKTF